MPPQTRAGMWLGLPVLLALLGMTWMYAAVQHFERQTGRAFYGLAAQHYSVPDWKMVYHPDGERIERLTVTLPSNTTFLALLASLILALGKEYRVRKWPWVVACVAWHSLVAIGFALIVFWTSINVVGVFI